MKWSAADTAETPDAVVTVTSTVPALAAGLIATICVAVLLVMVAAFVPKRTVVASARFAPLIVTVEPPPTRPVAGATFVTVGTCVTLNVAKGLSVPMVAVTVPEAVVLGTLNRPPLLIVPKLVVQATAGGAVNGLPNWSLPVTLNCCVCAPRKFADVGLTARVVGVWFTVTATLLVPVRPLGSVIVTVKA